MKIIKVLLLTINHLMVPTYLVGVWMFFSDSILNHMKGHYNTGTSGWIFALVGLVSFSTLLLMVVKIEKNLLRKEENNIANKCDRENMRGVTRGEKINGAETSRLATERSLMSTKQILSMVILGAIYFPLRLKNTLDIEYFYYTTFLYLVVCLLEWGFYRILRYKSYDRYWMIERIK